MKDNKTYVLFSVFLVSLSCLLSTSYVLCAITQYQMKIDMAPAFLGLMIYCERIKQSQKLNVELLTEENEWPSERSDSIP